MITVRIANAQSTLSIDRHWYVRLAKFALRAELVEAAELSVAFVDNAEIHRLNKQFLRHDYATDVITFPLSEEGETLHGEIVISAEYAAGEAKSYSWTPELETALYLVHGILHLCGYDDHSKRDSERMKKRQAEILQAFQEAEESRDKKRIAAKGALEKRSREKRPRVSKRSERTSKRQ